MLEVTFKARIEPRPDGGFVARFLGLEGCVCEGDTREEVEAKARKALTAYLKTLRTHGKPIPPQALPKWSPRRNASNT